MTLRTCALLLAALAAPLAAQEASDHAARVLTDTDYARADRMMAWHVDPLVSGGTVRPTWIGGGRFWYRTTTPHGSTFIVVDPERRTSGPLFDQVRVAATLSRAADTTLDPDHLPFARADVSADGTAMTVVVNRRRFTCDLRTASCTPAAPSQVPRDAVVSPNGKLAVFIRDWNLWMRDLETGQETALTTDGVKDFGYATDNAGWTHSDRPVVLWSPDSRRIATFQQDQRGVGEMYLVDTRVGHPVLDAWKYPLPGDSIVTTIQRVVIDVGARRVVRLRMPPDQHRSTTCDHIQCRGVFTDVEWYPDGSHLAFVSTSRDHKTEHLRVADAATGDVRDVLEEVVPDFFESGYEMPDWHVLPAGNEVIWYSQRDDWGHLYLYDLATGHLKNRITSGAWKVLQVLRVDAPHRTVYFTAAGREPGDPYFRHLYSVRLDGSHLALLTPDSADHEVSLSPDGRWIVDSYSTPVTPPMTVVRDLDGRVRMRVQTTDISRLVAAGWKPPIPFSVKARDGKTDLYGLLFRPTNFDSTKRYPIIDHIYPGPQAGSVGSRSFVAARGDAQALAELGFVVVELDAMGTPMRSHSFQAAYYGNMGDNGLPDQVAGMRQLAQRDPWIDLDRAGIYGHSGGGYATADAMFRYPDVFTVGVSEAGNHDNREYEDDWGEKWQGLLVRRPDGTTTYDNQDNESQAKNLKGKLLIAFGTMDDNVPPYNSLLVVDSLIAHNKDFDLIVLPNRHHGFGNEPYMVRRRWDYFVRWLMGAEPPREYRMRSAVQGGTPPF